MAFDAFLKVDTVPGESTDSGHKDWIEILGYNHRKSFSRLPLRQYRWRKGTAERCEHKNFEVVKFIDKASPKLYEACCKGSHLKDVTIELCRAGGDKVKYMEIKMEKVIVSRISPIGDPKGKDAFPTREGVLQLRDNRLDLHYSRSTTTAAAVAMSRPGGPY